MRLYAIIFMMFFLPVFAKAGDSSVYIHYDITNGLPSNNVYMTLQDHLGYMWFATENGVIKYNGYDFRLYTTADGLPTNDVYKIFEDTRGRMWIYSLSHDFGYISNDKYVSFSKKTKSISYPSIIMERGKKVSFIAYAQLNNDEVMKHYVFTENDSNEFNSYLLTNELLKINYYEVQFSRSGNFYAITKDDKVYRSNVAQAPHFKFEFLSVLPYKVVSNKGRSNLFEDHFLYSYWTRDSVIYQCDLKSFKPHSLELKSTDSISEHAYISYCDSFYLHIISNKNIYTIDSDFSVLNKQSIDLSTFGGTQVSWFTKDNLGNTWYSTNSEAVYQKLDDRNILTLKRPDGVHAKALFMGEDQNVSYWYSEPVDELYSIGKSGRVHTYKIKGEGRMRGISVIDSNHLCVAFNSGIYSFDLSTQVLSSFFAKYKKMVAHKFSIYTINNNISEFVNDTLKKTILSNSIKVANGRKNEFFIITSAGAYLVKTYKDSVFSVLLYSDRFSNVEYDSADRCAFFYNSNKLCLYDEGKGVVTEMDIRQISHGLMKRIMCLKTDSKSNLFLLGDNNLVVYDIRTHDTRQIPINCNMVSGAMTVSGNKLIIAGRFGIGMADVAGPCSVSRFKYWMNVKDRSFRQVFNLSSSGEGQVVLNTDRGVFRTWIDPTRSGTEFTNVPGKFFTLVWQGNSVVRASGNDTLRVDQKTDALAFDVINFYGSGTVNYSYKVRGVDKDFKRFVSGEFLLNSLDAGRVYAIDIVLEDDLWKSNPYTIYIYRKPFWYQTTIWKVAFWAGGILFFASLVLITIYFTRRYVAKANEKRQQLTDLELRAIHSQINPHFIFNTLSTALYFINRNEMEAAYEHVNKFSHLLRAYLKSSQDRYINLASEIEMLRKYIELQQARFSEKFDFVIEVDNKLPANHIMIPSLLLQPLVENAINHGLFHKKEKGLLKIYFEEGNTNDVLICVIDDNGVGRAQSKLIKNTSEITRESYGNKLTQGLIDIFAQYEQMNIDIAYTDKMPPETGTIVKLTIRNIKYVAGN